MHSISSEAVSSLFLKVLHLVEWHVTSTTVPLFPKGWSLNLGPTVRAFREQLQVVALTLPHRRHGTGTKLEVRG